MRRTLPYPIGDEGVQGCLCWATGAMYRAEIITWEEAESLRSFIKTKRPRKADLFWWPYGELSPRLEFIDKLIAEL